MKCDGNIRKPVSLKQAGSIPLSQPMVNRNATFITYLIFFSSSISISSIYMELKIVPWVTHYKTPLKKILKVKVKMRTNVFMKDCHVPVCYDAD